MKKPTKSVNFNYSNRMESFVSFVRQHIFFVLLLAFITSFTVYVFIPKNGQIVFDFTEVDKLPLSNPIDPLTSSVLPTITGVTDFPEVTQSEIFYVKKPTEGKKKKYSSEPYTPAHYLIDKNSSSLFPWKDSKDQECKGYQINFGLNGSFGRRILVSFPGSGSPFLRFITERAAGFFTGTSGNNGRGGFLDPFDGRRILLETDLHSFYNLNDSFHGILLLRNPLDAIIASWKELNKFEPNFDNKRWASFVKEKIEMWHLGLKMWFEKYPDNDVILYEDLIGNAAGREILKMIDFLRIPVDAVRIQCTLREMEKRKKDFTLNDPVDTSFRLNAYSNHLLKIFSQHIESINHFLKARGIHLKLNY